MEPLLIASYRAMLDAHPAECSVDRILEDPALRAEYVERVRASACARTEFEILHTLNNLRKRSKLPRRSSA